MRRPSTTLLPIPTTMNGVVRDAYKVRQEVEHRLFINTCERLRLELIIKRLDAEFAGQSFIDDGPAHDPTNDPKETKQ